MFLLERKEGEIFVLYFLTKNHSGKASIVLLLSS